MSAKLKRRKRKLGRHATGQSVREDLASAIRKHQEGHIEEAAKVYRAILAASPHHIDALNFLGVAEHQLGQSEKALQLMGRALALKPDHPDILNNRGNVLKQLRRLDEAEADYRRALELRPRDANALNNLGTVRRERGDLEGAVVTFREVIALRPDHAPAWQNLGNALGSLDRVEEALDAYREAMRLAPQEAESHRQLGALLSTVGRVEEAAEIYRRWHALFPDDPRARHLLAACSGEAAPLRASDEYVRAEFERFAPNFDANLARLDYRGPALIAEAVAQVFGEPQGRLAVLDAGCGTGLCGPLLRPAARVLLGVDLSAAMVELARARGVYDTLVVQELTAFLAQHVLTSDLIVSADTLVYFGDLTDVIMAAARVLRPTGALIFTVERAEPQDAPKGYRINPHGRYSHTLGYLQHVLGEAGFVDTAIREVTTRKEAEKWVRGWLVSARIPAVPTIRGADPTA
jgi:predicted TPR repeat methyltransferase